jgi:hypothetical protein
MAFDPARPITAENRVGDVLTVYPGLLDTFVAFGFKPLRNPLLRKTLARRVTIAQACRMMDVDTLKLLEVLNDLRAQQPTPARGESAGCGSSVTFAQWDHSLPRPTQKGDP